LRAAIDGLGFGEDDAAANVIAARLQGSALDEVDRPPQQMLKGVSETEQMFQWDPAFELEFHQEIGVARGRIEVYSAGGGAEDLEPLDAVALAQPDQVVALTGDLVVHGGIHLRSSVDPSTLRNAGTPSCIGQEGTVRLSIRVIGLGPTASFPCRRGSRPGA